jgi:hypothetical protein
MDVTNESKLISGIFVQYIHTELTQKYGVIRIVELHSADFKYEKKNILRVN